MTHSLSLPRTSVRHFTLYSGPPLALCAVALLAWPLAAPGLVITPVWDSSITSDPNAAIIQSTILSAINVYQTRFSDPITVSINFQETSSGLGQSQWVYYTIPYSQFRTDLQNDATTANDSLALSHLPAGSVNPVTGTTSINLKTANLKAIGITGDPSGLPGGADGIIRLNTSLMNLSRLSTDPSKYDLMSVAEHEIDEVLGLGSGLDLAASSPFPEDLFRYDSSGARTYTTSGDNAYFSLDGSALVARFNQNSGGDYGDWWTAGAHTPQVQDAFATPGTAPDLGTELTALDAVGYDLLAVTVPEPASPLLLAAGGLLLALRPRRG